MFKCLGHSDSILWMPEVPKIQCIQHLGDLSKMGNLILMMMEKKVVFKLKLKKQNKTNLDKCRKPLNISE